MRDYQRIKTDIVIPVVRPIVVDIRQTTIVRVTTDETVIVLE